MAPAPDQFVSRAGAKLAAALDAFVLDVATLIAADLGSNAGGFVDCLLQRGATRVYAVERGYGVLDYRLRRDPRVVVLERTNALTVRLPEPVALVTIDAGWTRQRLILPAARRLLAPDGQIVSLVKPHYEAERSRLRGGVLPTEDVEAVVARVRVDAQVAGLKIVGEIDSPLPGRAGNRERLWWLVQA